MKNAYVLDMHHGDHGTVDVGMILLDLSNQRFEDLEKRGLVREATADEVKAGYQPPFTPEADPAGADGDPLESIDLDDPAHANARRVAEEAQKFINQLRDDHGKALDAERERGDAAEKALGDERERADAAGKDLDEARKEIDGMKTTAAESAEALAAARAEVEQLKAAGTKQDKAPANKKAAEPANKGA